jgi:hypothetical protein
MAQMTIGGRHAEEMDDGMQRVEFKTLDGSESSIYLHVDAMSGEFLPFRPPPLPQPQSASEMALAESEAAEAAEAAAEANTPQMRMYKAMFTIEESTQPDGEVRIVAHSPRIINEEQPKSFLERLAARQLRFDENRRSGGDMQAISVKRQRKLRMKKKKYKKLMKKTRNIRQKLDRT